jgi:hypothetical protein
MQETADLHQITWTQVCLVFAALACCMGCLWMVFFFGRKIQTSAYVRASLVNAAKGEELRNLMRDLEAKKVAGPLDPSKPPPPGFEKEARRMWQPQAPPSGPSVSVPYIPAEASVEQQQVLYREHAEREAARRAPFDQWYADEYERWFTLVKTAEITAEVNAERRVPRSMDIAILGGGWSFLLEFSTVIVIIFVLLCLGILNSLTGRDLTTIMASIAGYVLGKASISLGKGKESGDSVS